MVSRVESNGEQWGFAFNVMPGTTESIADLLPTGAIRRHLISCSPDNSYTQIIKCTEVGGETGLMKFEGSFILREGDPYYIASVYIEELRERVEFRVSHQTTF